MADDKTNWSRIVVVGTSCSGKTTLARALASRLDAPHVELDALYWLPGWRNRSDDEFRDLVAAQTAGTRWVVDGNYRRVARALLWPRASVIVWINYPLALVLWRGLRRTFRRAITAEELFGGNRESLQRALLSRELDPVVDRQDLGPAPTGLRRVVRAAALSDGGAEAAGRCRTSAGETGSASGNRSVPTVRLAVRLSITRRSGATSARTGISSCAVRFSRRGRRAAPWRRRRPASWSRRRPPC